MSDEEIPNEEIPVIAFDLEEIYDEREAPHLFRSSERIKPIFVTHEQGVIDLEKQAVISALEQILIITEVQDKISIKDLSHWNSGDHLNEDGSLKPHHSVDWYIQQGRETSEKKNQLNTNTIVELLKDKPYLDLGMPKHYDIMILHSQMYSAKELHTLSGIAERYLGSLISLYDARTLVSEDMRYEYIRTVTFHEFGHVLLADARSENVEEIYGKHCSNEGCSMRQLLTRVTRDRLKHNSIYCEDCMAGIKKYFSEG